MASHLSKYLISTLIKNKRLSQDLAMNVIFPSTAHFKCFDNISRYLTEMFKASEIILNMFLAMSTSN